MRLIDSATKMQVIQHIQLSKIKYCQNHPLPLQVNYSGAAKDGQKIVGGGERDRTDDLLRARQALSQLSYTPIGARSAAPHLAAIGPAHVLMYASPSRLPQTAALLNGHRG